MKLSGKPTEYQCDKCGSIHERKDIASLSQYFQPGGIIGYKQGNLGVRHLCQPCKTQFEAEYQAWFTNYNMVKNPPKRVFIKVH